MAVTWTKEQQSVIALRNRNLLVSAAAGSGKTAVLVERILAKICEPQSPVDIDRLLIVTFTKAAAAEMRERLLSALEERGRREPDNANIERQLALLHNAMITTIDSFCVYVVRNYFQDIGLAPDFRIADPGELRLLEEDALDALFEKNYAGEDNAAFLALIDAYADKRSDARVRDMVKKIYRLAVSHPWPKEWLTKLLLPYQAKTEDELGAAGITEVCIRLAKKQLAEWKRELSALREQARAVSGLEKYVATLDADLELWSDADAVSDYAGMRNFLAAHSMGNIAAIRGFAGDEAAKEAIKEKRNAIKAELEQLKKDYFFLSAEELLAQQKRLYPVAEELIRLTLAYMEELADKKSRKHVADFNDIEHDALNILVDEATRQCRPAAVEFRHHFDEIMIDEYQDSNEVQEAILRAISGESEGRNNLFMVGDVKQSIYRFRLARPELFMEKFDTYSLADSDCQRIDLHKNFRSRKEVLSGVNDIFSKIMSKDLGNVAYDEQAMLHYGASYPDAEGNETELLLLDKKEELFAGLEAEGDAVLEAHLVASRIRELKQKFSVTDQKTGTLRPVRYGDIVILLRSLKSWGMDFAHVLTEQGIPAQVESTTGYFSSVEVQTVLAMLRILDNPYQDIPMAAVLKSPMAGFSDEELAGLCVRHAELPFAMAVAAAAKEEEAGKLKDFWTLYTGLRAEVMDTPIHELLHHILDRTGYAAYAAMMPAGAQRSANLNMLMEKAIAYEKTSYKGLFHFVRYIDELQKYEVDFGEADIASENEDVVHIMTIHKSKGLEFPVVFVSGMNRQFNRMELRDAMVLHPELGMGLEERGAEPKIKRNTMHKSLIKEYLEQETLGEELRILYVALTRAKEKLILTGVVTDREKWAPAHRGNAKQGEPLAFLERRKAKSYLDLVFSAWLSYPGRYEVTFADPKTLVAKEVFSEAKTRLTRELMAEGIKNADQNAVSALDEQFSYVYPYLSEAGRKSKYSVSELKRLSMVEQFDRMQGDMEIPDFLLEEKESYLPAFARENAEEASLPVKGTKARTGQETVSRGALRGTAVHRFMECLDFTGLLGIDPSDEKAAKRFFTAQLRSMEQSGALPKEMADLVLPSLMVPFLMDPIALRMAKAAENGCLFREKPFVMDYEGVLLQGIIDVFWLEDDRIVVLDYKTDRVKSADELVVRYQTQLTLYGQALLRLYSTDEKPAASEERLIYSFCLGEVVRL